MVAKKDEKKDVKETKKAPVKKAAAAPAAKKPAAVAKKAPAAAKKEPKVEVVKKAPSKIKATVAMEDLKVAVEKKEAEVVAVAGKVPAAPKTKKKDAKGRFYSTGKRKDACARVWIKNGNGKVIVNGKEIEKYFVRPVLRMIINQPFVVTNRVGQYDVMCTVSGGGLSGQAGALRHGISRCLNEFEPDLHAVLRKAGFLTRDPRSVERKKYGMAKARKRYQFSKR